MRPLHSLPHSASAAFAGCSRSFRQSQTAETVGSQIARARRQDSSRSRGCARPRRQQYGRDAPHVARNAAVKSRGCAYSPMISGNITPSLSVWACRRSRRLRLAPDGERSLRSPFALAKQVGRPRGSARPERQHYVVSTASFRFTAFRETGRPHSADHLCLTLRRHAPRPAARAHPDTLASAARRAALPAKSPSIGFALKRLRRGISPADPRKLNPAPCGGWHERTAKRYDARSCASGRLPCSPGDGTTRRYLYLPLPMPQAQHMTGVLAFQVFRPGN